MSAAGGAGERAGTTTASASGDGLPASPAPWVRLLVFVIPALWSTNYLLARLGDGVIGPHALALGRWALAALLMLPFAGAALLRKRAVLRREWPHLLVLGGLGMYICGAWVYVAGHTTSATNISLIYAVTPVAIAWLSARLLHERLSPLQRWAVLLAMTGALFVVTRGDPAVLMQLRLAPGDFWIMAAAASWTAYSVLLRLWPSELGPAERLVAIIAGGLVFLVPGALVEWWVASPAPLGGKALVLVLVAAVVPGVASYGAYSYLQREIGAARTALMLYLAPVYGAFGSWWLLGERPGWHHAIGGVLILSSIALATRR